MVSSARFRVNAKGGSIRKIGLERTNVGRQLLDPLVESMQMRVPIFQGNAECNFSTGTIEKRTHRISCQVRYAARAGE